MLQLPVGREASLGVDALRYERHRPERTLLYQLVEEYYPVFETQWAAEGPGSLRKGYWPRRRVGW